jgi:hypothetical protein
MTGADAPALRALAAQMSQSAGRLDAIRTGIRSRLYSVQWDGPDGQNFRRMWDGQHVPMLARVADGLRGSAERLLAEAAQQEGASGAGGYALGGGVTIGPSTGRADADDWADAADDLLDQINLWLGGAGAVAGSFLAGYGVRVSEHVRANGTRVAEYWRWSAGHAADLNRYLSASDLARADRVLDIGGKVLPFASGGVAGYQQWQEDEAGNYSTSERATRAVAGGAAAGATDYLMDAGAMYAGAAIGTMIAPGIGTLVGGMIGWGVSAAVSLQWGDQISDFASDVGADIGSGLHAAGSAVVDFGGDVLETGGELLGDATDVAGDVWDWLT